MNKINDILKKLSNKDIKEIKECLSTNYVMYPKMSKDGRILPSQWKVWQNLQRWNLGFIRGNDEMGEFTLNEFGKQVAQEIK